MILYLDTSSLVKLFVEEEGSADVAALAAGSDVVATSRVAYAEARAALARARRMGRLTARSWRTAVRTFEEAWGAFLAVEVTDPLVRLASVLSERHALRGFDSIHLASALFLQRESGQPIVFLAADALLMDAARDEGLPS